MSENLSFFDQYNTDTESNVVHFGSPKIDVVKMDFSEAQSVTWEELFDGFDRLYAITYSSGIEFICQLLKRFQYAEIIFGYDEVISYSLQEVMAYQLKTVERGFIITHR